MNYIAAVLLGLIQGLTEFLPVSSSGHLAIFQHIPFIKDAIPVLTENMTFDILLHFATLISVFIVFWRDIWKLILAFFGMIADLFRGKPNLNDPYRRMVLLLIVAVIPAAVLGLLFKDVLEGLKQYLWVVGFALLITACVTYLSDKLAHGRKTAGEASYGSALTVGVFQAVAMVPGISRSGSTIFAGLLCGFDRRFAVKFSFLLSIPTILGAALVQSIDVVQQGFDMANLFPFLLGGLAAAVAGIFAIKFLVSLLNKNKFYFFSIYCALMGAAVMLYGLFHI